MAAVVRDTHGSESGIKTYLGNLIRVNMEEGTLPDDFRLTKKPQSLIKNNLRYWKQIEESVPRKTSDVVIIYILG